MVGKNLLKEKSVRMNPDDIPTIPARYRKPKAEAAGGSGRKKVRPSITESSSASDVEECTVDGRVLETHSVRKRGTSWRRCPLREKSKLQKVRRDERCKYCRRLLSHSSSVWLGKRAKGDSPMSPPSITSRPCSSRRLLDSPMDEVAWACGRLWCSVRRRKRRKVSSNFQRKQINDAFSTLREILPPTAQTEDSDSAAAKVSTLRLAASYIQALSDLLKDTHLTDPSSGEKKGNRDDSASDDDQRDSSVFSKREDVTLMHLQPKDTPVNHSSDYPPRGIDEGGKSYAYSNLKSSLDICKKNFPNLVQGEANHKDFFRCASSRRYQTV